MELLSTLLLRDMEKEKSERVLQVVANEEGRKGEII